MSDWSRRGQCRRNKILGLLCFIFASSILLFLAVVGWYVVSSGVRGQTENGASPPFIHNSLEMKALYYNIKSSVGEVSAGATPTNFNLGLHSVIFMGCELGLLIIQTTHVLILAIFEQVRTKGYKEGEEEETTPKDDEVYANIIHSINFKFDLISLLFDLVSSSKTYLKIDKPRFCRILFHDP